MSAIKMPDAGKILNTTPFDVNLWFSDIEINALLFKIITRKGHGFINPLVTLILATNVMPNYSLPQDLFDCDLIFCPLNINQMHWVLVVFNKVSRMTYILDSYDNGFMTNVTTKLAQNLNLSLNSILKCSNDFRHVPPMVNSYQNNGNDCGPFVCFFAQQLSLGFPLTACRSEILSLRRLAHILVNSDNSKPIGKLKAGGFDYPNTDDMQF